LNGSGGTGRRLKNGSGTWRAWRDRGFLMKVREELSEENRKLRMELEERKNEDNR
jgi:hypothetical protein